MSGSEKSRASARLFAEASRTESGVRFQRHSIIRRIDAWSNVRLATPPLRVHGETRRHGTRKPRSAYAGSTSGASEGGTWSKNPPHSSKVITRRVRGHAGDVVTARYVPASQASPARTSPNGWSSEDSPELSPALGASTNATAGRRPVAQSSR